MLIAPGRYDLLLPARGSTGLGWTCLDLVATKHWLAPIRLLQVPSLLKPAVERCDSKLLSFPWWLSWSLYRLLAGRFVVFYIGGLLRSRRCTRV